MLICCLHLIYQKNHPVHHSAENLKIPFNNIPGPVPHPYPHEDPRLQQCLILNRVLVRIQQELIGGFSDHFLFEISGRDRMVPSLESDIFPILPVKGLVITFALLCANKEINIP